jgi:hypothetical protein
MMQSHTFWMYDMILVKIIIDYLEKEIMFVSISQGDHPGIDIDIIFREKFKGIKTFQEGLARIEHKIQPKCPMNLDNMFAILLEHGKLFYTYT